MYELLVGEAPFEDSPVMTKRKTMRGGILFQALSVLRRKT
jgi:hypothetical protein